MPYARPIDVVGLVWYREDQWDAICAIMVDAHKLPASFQDWQRAAQEGEEALKRKGQFPVRAIIDATTVPAWCRQRGLKLDAQARMHYASLVAHQSYQPGHG